MVTCLEHDQKGTGAGYGRTHYKGQQAALHRVVYCKYYGVSLKDIHGLHVRHTCDNPRCINPEHLLLGTQQDNMDDRTIRGRSAKGATHGLTKLNINDIQYIRENYKPRCRVNGTRALGRKFGVHNSQVSAIISRKSWGHIQ